MGTEVFDEAFVSLATGGGKAGEYFPCASASLGFVARRGLACDDHWGQGSLGTVVDGFDIGITQERKEPLSTFAPTVDDPFLIGVEARRSK